MWGSPLGLKPFPKGLLVLHQEKSFGLELVHSLPKHVIVEETLRPKFHHSIGLSPIIL